MLEPGKPKAGRKRLILAGVAGVLAVLAALGVLPAALVPVLQEAAAEL